MCKANEIIEMHSTWLTINSIVGCTNGCKYCFLQSTNDNLKKPATKASAEYAFSLLLKSKYFDKNIPVCLLPNTDPFLNENNINYTKELLELTSQNKLTNPIILITKCLIPKYFIEFLKELQEKGLTIVIYLSFSGLDSSYEPNINHEHIKENFKNLAANNIPIVHYYRPFIPANSNPAKMKEILDFVHQYTKISKITGLNVKSSYFDKLSFWPELQKRKEECLKALAVWPKDAYEFFHKDYNHVQNVFQTNACALAQILKKASPAHYGTKECLMYNHCSEEQRKRCSLLKKENTNLKEKLIYLLDKIEKNNNDIIIEISNNLIKIKNSDLTIGDCAYLTFMLGTKVCIETKLENDNYFNSSYTNAEHLIIE